MVFHFVLGLAVQEKMFPLEIWAKITLVAVWIFIETNFAINLEEEEAPFDTVVAFVLVGRIGSCLNAAMSFQNTKISKFPRIFSQKREFFSSF